MILFPDQPWDAVVSHLKSAQHVLLTTHRSPDADGIGSQLALYDILSNMGIKVSMANRDSVPRICRYLPNSGKIIKTEFPDAETVDTIIALDAGARSRLGFSERLYDGRTLINIDHHASNPLYGDINVINPEYCATGAMIFDLAQHLGQQLTKDSATAIYAAILTDTASFRGERVDSAVHRMTAELIDAGASAAEAASAIYDTQPLGRITLLSKALQTLAVANNGRSAWMHVTQTMLDESGADTEDTEGFIDLSKTIEGVEVIVFIRPESETSWKASFRGKDGRDVSEIAVALNGGGHRYASGCSIAGTLDDVYEKIRAVVDAKLA